MDRSATKVKSYFSHLKTKAIVGEKNLTVYEFIGPGKSISIKEELSFDKDIVTGYRAEIVSAQPKY